jgi:thiol-disulfide isomerase/thioredoxin
MKVLAYCVVCCATVALAEDFKTVAGKEYKNVTVTRVEPDGIVLKSNSGISKVYFVELPSEVQQRFHYNATAAAAYSTAQAAAYSTAQPAAYSTVQAAAQPKVAGRGQPVEVISHGAQVDINQHLAFGNVTVVDFYADWCGPCRQLSPTLEQMATNDPEVALRKIDIVNWRTAVAQQFNIRSIPQVNVYNRSGRLVGTVVGVNLEQVRRYVAQAKRGG